LEITGAARYDKYSDFGGTANPKVAFGLRPNKNLLIRASYGTAFKAPTLFQLYEAQAAGGYDELADPIRCAFTNDPADCDGRLIEVRSGGSVPNGVDLKPEESTNTTAGIVFEVANGLTVSLDGWRINKKNAITQFGAQTAIINEAPSVLRNPTVGGVPGSIIRVTTSYFNANAQDIQGADLEINYKSKMAGGVLGVRYGTTFLKKFDQFSDGCSPCDYRGNYDGPGATPIHKGLLGLSWQQGAWTVSGQANFLGGYNFVAGARAAGATVDQPYVSSFTTYDGQLAYMGLKNTEVRLGARNLTDKPPQPLAFFPSGTDSSLYDARGRFVYVSVIHKLK